MANVFDQGGDFYTYKKRPETVEAVNVTMSTLDKVGVLIGSTTMSVDTTTRPFSITFDGNGTPITVLEDDFLVKDGAGGYYTQSSADFFAKYEA